MSRSYISWTVGCRAMVSFEDCSRSINVMIKCLLFQKILASLISPHFPHNGPVLTSKISSKLVAYWT